MTVMPHKEPRVRVERGLSRRGDTWYASVTPPGQRHERFRSLGKGFGVREARRRRDLAVPEILAAHRDAEDLGDAPRFGEIVDAFIASKRKLVTAGKLRSTTLAGYEYSVPHVKPWMDERAAVARYLTPEDLIAWHEDAIGTGAAAGTIRTWWALVTGAFTYGVRHGHVQANLPSALERHERPSAGAPRHRILSEQEMRQLLAAAPTDRWRLLWAVLLFAGPRISEALALHWRDLDRGESVLRFREQLERTGRLGPLKTDAGVRDVMLMEQLEKLLLRYRLASSSSQPGDLLFATLQGRPLDYHNVAREFRKTVERAGLTGTSVTPHTLRHTFASILIFEGADAAFVADQLGHADASVTLRVYAKLFRAAKQRSQMRDRLGDAYGAIITGSGA